MYFKGIVMEISTNNIIVMNQKGAMIKLIKKDELSIGDTIYFLEEDIIINDTTNKVNKKKSWIIPLAIVAMLSIIFISPIMNGKIGIKSYAMVSLDVNPSVSFKLDKNQNVIEVNGLNTDGKNLELDNLIGMNLEESLKVISNILVEEGYLTSKGDILASLSFYKEVDDSIYEEKVKASLTNVFNEADIVYIKSNKNSVKESEKKDISIGRYQAYLELKDKLSEDSIETITVEELNKLLKEYTDSIYLNERALDEINDELDNISDEINNIEEENIINEDESISNEEQNTINVQNNIDESIYTNEDDDINEENNNQNNDYLDDDDENSGSLDSEEDELDNNDSDDED